MINPLRHIKDIIDILRNPPGNALAACEITSDVDGDVAELIGTDNMKYIRHGHFLVEFENLVTIVPPKDFHKHYAFIEGSHVSNMMSPVRTIKPL